MVPLPKIGPGSAFEPLQIRRGEKVFVLTGAGISAESGVRTFRGAGGLWEEHRIEDVATPEGFARDPQLVWRFYGARRNQVHAVRPNPAHLALAKIEEQIGSDLFLCTQNVDPLHEAAGSRRVLHMHGELCKTRCSSCERLCSSVAFSSRVLSSWASAFLASNCLSNCPSLLRKSLSKFCHF